jgi:hypothetical protein
MLNGITILVRESRHDRPQGSGAPIVVRPSTY